MTRNRRLRVRPTPIQYRSSGSWKTCASLDVRSVADPVPPDGVRPPRVVDGRVEDVRAASGRTARRRRCPRSRRGTSRRRRPATGRGSCTARRPRCRPPQSSRRAVGADVEAAERVEVVPLGLDVVVEQDLLAGEAVALGLLVERRRLPVVGGCDRRPAVDAVLLALDRAGVVPPVALAGRDAQVGLAGARLDLVEDLLAQDREVLGARVRVRVLLVQVRDDRRIVLLAQPLVVVDVDVAVVDAFDGLLRL